MADVVEDGAASRRDDADPAGEADEAPLAGLVEQAVFLELCLEALELHLQCADAFRLHKVDVQLEISTLLIE